ncbi:hypothetical protein [Tenacibaculum sp. M341]|uniref:hypothetical protein n=1 Tax=Tenacibaculum sp. M341 TaxID=2530339 RepID=UPI00104D3923|nr:hypothetical protein [Tenacibaculum sp. M341]TCI85703.1 hypothetical protein EYW44_16080 [Tenacibaculum sp. M341]
MNKGIYIEIIENNKVQSKWNENRIFWSESSDIYTFLRNHTLKIEYKFNIKINSLSNNEIPMDGIKILLKGIKKDLVFLIKEFENNPVTNELNWVEEKYMGKE